jgi:hypothetical protein
LRQRQSMETECGTRSGHMVQRLVVSHGQIREALANAYCVGGSSGGLWHVAQSPGLRRKPVLMSGEFQRCCKRIHGPGGPTGRGERWHQAICHVGMTQRLWDMQTRPGVSQEGLVEARAPRRTGAELHWRCNRVAWRRRCWGQALTGLMLIRWWWEALG